MASQVLGYLYAWCSLHEHTFLGGGTFAAVYVSRCLKAVGFFLGPPGICIRALEVLLVLLVRIGFLQQESSQR